MPPSQRKMTNLESILVPEHNCLEFSDDFIAMAIILDIDAAIEELKGKKPPYKCPVCGKSFKTFAGISQHLIACSQDIKQDQSEDEKPVGLPHSR